MVVAALHGGDGDPSVTFANLRASEGEKVSEREQASASWQSWSLLRPDRWS
jgi:hypothetical protein